MARSAEERFPDIVVGVDFGMTCTGGVAYTSGPEWGPPRTIQRWPGKLISELANKVPTSLVYNPDGRTVKDWGFGCDSEDMTADIRSMAMGITQQEARRWFQDYVSCIYRHVVAHLNSFIPGFQTQRVEFIFSVPTTWKDVRMIEEIRGLLNGAIHGGPNHWACIGLTEAEAAAVYACQNQYKVGELICSPAGVGRRLVSFYILSSISDGPQDVNVLRLTSARGAPVQLEQLGNVEGRPIGSVFIDRAIHKLITERLSKVKDELLERPEHIAWKMLTGRFQRLKCAFGTEAARTPCLSLDVPFLKNPETALPDAGISDGQMRIEWDHVKRAFDLKIHEMYELLDGQIRNMQYRYPFDRISYLVLSGGFGSSPYVRECLHERYALPGVGRHPNVLGLQVLMAEEPQLAVVHGLVLDRIQQMKRGVTMFGSRCSPVSYGIMCDVLYDKEQHLGERVRRDPRDDNLYAVGQIDWLVIQGQPVPHTGISKDFQRKMDPGQEHLPWTVQIVMSTNPPDQLPQSMSAQGVQRVCSLDIRTDEVDRKLKNRHWYNARPRYWRAIFDVRVVVGAADLSFQLWSRDRRIRSTEHEPIKVQWMPAEEVDEDNVML
ncbi:hypothetical protein BJX61DRAFT_551448 [Aspergillus egyptiacus]|nr:hypothetical protein BJX61DRAFT_551448 [Aspergillus egyptiacus]